MFEGDTYFIHVAGAEVALAVFSGLLVFLAIAAVRLARRRVELAAAAPAIGIVFWWLFLWLTPQLYYLLYVALSDALAFDLIIGWPPGPGRMMELLGFRGEASLTDFAVGVLGWAMILASLPRA